MREGHLDVGLADQPLQGLAAGQPHRPVRQLGQRHVELREAPDRCALKYRELFDNRRDLGDQLHSRGAGADHGDPFAGQVLGVVPAGGVHGDAAEGVDAVDVGRLGHGEHTAGVEHESCRDFSARIELHPPQRPLVVELGGEHLGVEPDLRPDAVLVGAVFGVRLQFAAARIGARPVRPLLERELVGRRRDVHGDTGIGVPVPGAADVVAGLDDEVVAEALLIELDRGADAGESRADDQQW